MKLEKIKNHQAYKSLIALMPTHPEEFLSGVAKIGHECYDGKDLLDQQELLSVCRQTRDDEEELTIITMLIDEEDDVIIKVFNYVDDETAPFFGYNSYGTFESMVRMLDSVLEEGESWCGNYERQLFGQLAEADLS